MKTLACTLLAFGCLMGCSKKTTAEADWSPQDQNAGFNGGLGGDSSNENQGSEDTPNEGTPEQDANDSGEPDDPTITDGWTVAEEPPTDILIYIDQSSSMDDNHALLREQTSAFIGSIESYSDDWQMIIAINDDGCNQTDGVLRPSDSDYVMRFQQGIAGTSEEDEEGETTTAGGWLTEAGLDIVSRAVDMTDSGECNHGFLREDALLHMILISDEPDQSSAGWSWYVDKVVAKKRSASLVKFSAIAGPYPDGCETADPGNGYHQAVESTGGLFLSICDSWATPDNLRRLAEASTLQASYTLSQNPDTDSIVVRVNGTERTDGWSYDTSNNAIVFEAPLPAPGAEIEVRYLPAD